MDLPSRQPVGDKATLLRPRDFHECHPISNTLFSAVLPHVPLGCVLSSQIRKSMADAGADVFVCGLLDEVPHSADEAFLPVPIPLRFVHYSPLSYQELDRIGRYQQFCRGSLRMPGDSVLWIRRAEMCRSTPNDLGCSIAGRVHPQPSRKRRRSLASRDSIPPHHGGWGKGVHRPRKSVHRSGGGDEGKNIDAVRRAPRVRIGGWFGIFPPRFSSKLWNSFVIYSSVSSKWILLCAGTDFLQPTTANTIRLPVCHPSPVTSLISYPRLCYSASRQACRVEVHAYEEALDAVRALANEGKRVWIDPDRVNYAFANVVSKDRCAEKAWLGFFEEPKSSCLRCRCTPYRR